MLCRLLFVFVPSLEPAERVGTSRPDCSTFFILFHSLFGATKAWPQFRPGGGRQVAPPSGTTVCSFLLVVIIIILQTVVFSLTSRPNKIHSVAVDILVVFFFPAAFLHTAFCPFVEPTHVFVTGKEIVNMPADSFSQVFLFAH